MGLKFLLADDSLRRVLFLVKQQPFARVDWQNRANWSARWGSPPLDPQTDGDIQNLPGVSEATLRGVSAGGRLIDRAGTRFSKLNWARSMAITWDGATTRFGSGCSSTTEPWRLISTLLAR